MDDEDAVRRKLDEVVGSGYDTISSKGAAGWLRSRILKWAAGAVFAVGAMLLVVYTIESHRLPSAAQQQSHQAPKKPVTVTIVPAK
jgi:hypothetical protein